MAMIQISNLTLAGNDLLADTESFLTELTATDTNQIFGGKGKSGKKKSGKGRYGCYVGSSGRGGRGGNSGRGGRGGNSGRGGRGGRGRGGNSGRGGYGYGCGC
jgi:hypothetical protein